MDDGSQSSCIGSSGAWRLAYAARPHYDFEEVKHAVCAYDRKLESLGLYSVENHIYLFRGQSILYLGEVYDESIRSGDAEIETTGDPVVALSLTPKAKRGVASALDRFYGNRGITPTDRADIDRLAARAQSMALALQGTLETMHGAGNPVGAFPPDDLLRRAGIHRYDNVVF